MLPYLRENELEIISEPAISCLTSFETKMIEESVVRNHLNIIFSGQQYNFVHLYHHVCVRGWTLKYREEIFLILGENWKLMIARRDM